MKLVNPVILFVFFAYLASKHSISGRPVLHCSGFSLGQKVTVVINAELYVGRGISEIILLILDAGLLLGSSLYVFFRVNMEWIQLMSL